MVEVLTAVGIGAVVLTAAGGILAYGQHRAQRTSDLLTASVERGEVLRQLSEDADFLVSHPSNDVTMKTDRGAEDSLDREMGFLVHASWSGQPADERLADLAAVRYRLADLVVEPHRITRVLLRRQISSKRILANWQQGKELHEWPDNNVDAEVLANGVVSFDCVRIARTVDGRWQEVAQGDQESLTGNALRVRLVIAAPSLRARLSTPSDWDRIAGTARAAKRRWPRELSEQLHLSEWVIPLGPHTSPP